MIQNKESYHYLLKTPEKNKKDPQRGGKYFLLSQLPGPIILSREMGTPEKKKTTGYQWAWSMQTNCCTVIEKWVNDFTLTPVCIYVF